MKYENKIRAIASLISELASFFSTMVIYRKNTVPGRAQSEHIE